jgi:hypothetical protein
MNFAKILHNRDKIVTHSEAESAKLTDEVNKDRGGKK